MTVAEKSGMVVNSEKEVIGWVNAGEEVDLRDGDMIVSHHKTAEKLGLADEFKAQKADNAPAKEVKESKEEGDKVVRTRVPKIAISDDATYTVIKPDFDAAKDEGARGDVFKALLANTSVADFKAVAVPYKHVNREGVETREVSVMECFHYAIKRGVISIDA